MIREASQHGTRAIEFSTQLRADDFGGLRPLFEAFLDFPPTAPEVGAFKAGCMGGSLDQAKTGRSSKTACKQLR